MDTFGTHTNINSAEAITVDSAGLDVQGIVNYSLGIRQFGGSVILSKYSLDGGAIWTRSIGNASETINGISVASDGIYLTGGDFNGGIVQKYDKSGIQIWAKQFGFGTTPALKLDSSGRGVSATSTGVYVAGSLFANRTSKGWVVFVREYDFVGNVVWTEDLTNASGVIINGVHAHLQESTLQARLLVAYRAQPRLGTMTLFWLSMT